MSMGSGPDADGIDTEIDSVRWVRKRLGADDSDRSGFLTRYAEKRAESPGRAFEHGLICSNKTASVVRSHVRTFITVLTISFSGITVRNNGRIGKINAAASPAVVFHPNGTIFIPSITR